MHHAFPEDLITSLDLMPLMENIAAHATTRRGYESLMALVERKKAKMKPLPQRMLGSDTTTSRRRDRLLMMNEMGSTSTVYSGALKAFDKKEPQMLLLEVAKSIEQVHSGYQLVQEATTLLDVSKDEDTPWYPPMYGADTDPWDIKTTPETDDDEWLFLSPHEYTTEHILKAEQVINMLSKVWKWGQKSHITYIAPNMAQLASEINMEPLSEVFQEIEGKVEIVRVKSIMDIKGKSTYSVRIKEDRFPVLELLHQKHKELMDRGGKEYDEKVVAIQSEIEATTQQIVSGLAQKILSVSKTIDHGLDVVAFLDTVIARATYGASLNGVFPVVQDGGEISVEQFVHPVLSSAVVATDLVPVDLQLSSESGEQALIISGPNGGGKSMAMKSFAMASILTKLGIPVPQKSGSMRPRVDFFDEILVNIGDNQNVLDGESTWTSILNSCASMIDKINSNDDKSFLVLLDEFGSAGTDPEACGAVAQAILEEMMLKPCKIVVTTHSPRLKAMSYEHPSIGCAAVLLDENDSSLYKLPSFRLEYGIIGESYALGAASRTKPSLPDSVITRASELMSDSNGETEEKRTHKSYIQALTSSMEEQLERTKVSALSAEERLDEATKCQQAMVALAGSYDSHLQRQLDKLEDAFQSLRSENLNEVELIGKTIDELKLVRKKIISQQERLAQQGLRVLPVDYRLTPGDSVVILSNGELEGMTAIVVSDSSTADQPLGQNEVLVRPSSSLHAWDDVMLANLDPMVERPLILQRHELAIWQYDDFIDDSFKTQPATSIPNSKRKIDSLLATINSVAAKQNKPTPAKKTSEFRSSRDRKAANKGKRKKK
jgi:hypothetical protein